MTIESLPLRAILAGLLAFVFIDALVLLPWPRFRPVAFLLLLSCLPILLALWITQPKG